MFDWTKEKLDFLFREFRKRHPLLPVLAVPWLYVTIGRDRVGAEMDRVRPFRTGMVLLARVPWLALRAIPLAWQIVWLRLIFYPLLRKLKRQSFDALAKSWVFPKAFSHGADGERDFYLGNLTAQLDKRGIKLLTFYGEGASKGWFRLVWSRRKNLTQLPELCLLNPLSVFRMVGRQTVAALILFWNSLSERDPAFQKLSLLVSRDCLRYQTLRNGLFYWIGKQALTWWPARFLVMLYEGLAWEKCLWMGVREVAPDCKLVGYQHTVIVAQAFELRRPSNSIHALRPPDIILSTGKKAIELLKPGYVQFSSKFIPFGSFQHSSPNLGKISPRVAQKTLLVLPEGILSEMVFLFNAALDLSELLPDYRIVLRCHPAIPFGKVRPHLKRNLEELPNVVLSKSPMIEEDFNRASLVLYRGTAAVLYSILRGLKPFYLVKEAAEENVDPLFELREWREKVDSVLSLNRQIAAYATGSGVQQEKEWQMALEYVQEYVKPVDALSMDCFLESLS